MQGRHRGGTGEAEGRAYLGAVFGDIGEIEERYMRAYLGAVFGDALDAEGWVHVRKAEQRRLGARGDELEEGCAVLAAKLLQHLPQVADRGGEVVVTADVPMIRVPAVVSGPRRDHQ
jgi:hypothetical protein